MSTYTARTVPTQFVEANGIRFAYRRWGKQGALPLVFNQHFTGTWTTGIRLSLTVAGPKSSFILCVLEEEGVCACRDDASER